jgi:hypothetical protein
MGVVKRETQLKNEKGRRSDFRSQASIPELPNHGSAI